MIGLPQSSSASSRFGVTSVAQRDQFSQRADGVLFHQHLAAAGDHHRIDHQRHALAPAPARCAFATARDDLRRVEHPGLDRGDGKGLEHEPDLVGHARGRDRRDVEHASRMLRHDAGHRRRAVNAERGERLQVGLDARAAAVVGAGNGAARRAPLRSDADEVSLCREERIIYLRGVAGEPIRELPGLWVSLDRVEYNPHEEGTPDRPYGFVYHITIHNDSPRVVTIKGRKWVVTNADNSKLVIEGDGVVGECPRLTPGTQFHYQSYHLIASDSVAEGAYLGQVEDGERVFTRIPPFKMEVPSL